MQGQLERFTHDENQLEQAFTLEHQREIYFRAAAFVKTEVTADTWRVFQLAVVEGLPVEDVAKQTGKSMGAVYVSRARVMKRIKSAIQRFEESWNDA